MSYQCSSFLILPYSSRSYFSWNIVDYSKVNDYVDTRETNFLSNPKSWDFNTELPFPSAATVAMMPEWNNHGAILYSHVFRQDSESTIQKSWRLQESPDRDLFDAFAAFVVADQDVESAELLLINPDLFSSNGFMHGFAHRLSKMQASTKGNDDEKLGRMEREVADVYGLLGFCWDEAFRHTVSKTSASHSCYGRGYSR